MISLAYLATGAVTGRLHGDHQELVRHLEPSRRSRRALLDGLVDRAR